MRCEHNWQLGARDIDALISEFQHFGQAKLASSSASSPASIRGPKKLFGFPWIWVHQNELSMCSQRNPFFQLN